MTYQSVVRATAKNPVPNEEMRGLIEQSTIDESRPASQDRANATANIELVVPSDFSTLLERTSALSLAEIDRSIEELQKARNFLRNEKERMRQEMAEYLRLTQAAMGSAKAVAASIASFGTVAEDVSKSRAHI
jgi:hypothetical protein